MTTTFSTISFSQDKLQATILTSELIELMEYKLISLQKARDEDSSWNYGIEELKEEIKNLQDMYNNI